MPSQTLTRPTGFYDRTAQEAAEAAALLADLQAVLTRFGYQIVETPVVEYADLFLTKSGYDAVSRLFTFELHGRQLCLRSEFTPSAARLYIERFQHEPKPIRWQFAGPVFRYEAPTRGLTRQAMMLGTELIGSSGVGGDAETIGLAVAGLNAVGLTEWTVEIGHIGLISLLLDQFGLDRRMRRFVLGQIENLRRPERGRAYVETQLGRLYAGLPPALETMAAGQLLDLSPDESPDKLGSALQMLLESADLGTTGAGRTNEDIARRLLTKQRRAGQRTEILRALDFLERFSAIAGTPDQAFPALEALLPGDAAIRDALSSFRATVDLLTAYRIDPAQVRLNMGLARGLNYYTGIVFELYGPDRAPYGGGGRYDDLIGVVGATQDTPAVGFAYRLDRVLEALRARGLARAEVGAVRALVVPIEDDDNAEAVRTAMQLREATGQTVELYTPPARGLSQVLPRAARRGIPYVVIVGPEERAAGQVSLRNMATGAQQMQTVGQVIEVLKT